MKVPESIASEEELGRRVFSSKNAARAKRSRAPYHIFLEKSGETDISVDRLSVAPSDEAVAAIADKAAVARNATFYGWASTTAEEADRNERGVVANPLPDNPYHADIVLPELAAEDREEQKQHAKELADVSRWYSRPNPHEE